jgi:hypothetical protein
MIRRPRRGSGRACRIDRQPHLVLSVGLRALAELVPASSGISSRPTPYRLIPGSCRSTWRRIGCLVAGAAEIFHNHISCCCYMAARDIGSTGDTAASIMPTDQSAQ